MILHIRELEKSSKEWICESKTIAVHRSKRESIMARTVKEGCCNPVGHDEAVLMCTNVQWASATHKEVGLLMELDTAKGLGHSITDVGIGLDGLGNKLVGSGPIKKGEVLDINVASALGWCLCRNHEGSTRVVYIEDGGVGCGMAKIVEERPEIDNHLTGFGRSHEFSFGAREGDGLLVSRLVDNCGTGEQDDHAGHGATVSGVRSPVRVSVSLPGCPLRGGVAG